MSTKSSAKIDQATQAQDTLLNDCLCFYDLELKSRLEPEHDGEFVAIHHASHDYAVARTSGDAMRAIRAGHPDGAILLHRIGLSAANAALATRMLGARIIARYQK